MRASQSLSAATGQNLVWRSRSLFGGELGVALKKHNHARVLGILGKTGSSEEMGMRLMK